MKANYYISPMTHTSILMNTTLIDKELPLDKEYDLKSFSPSLSLLHTVL
jgi:hypothetical protein